MVRFHGDLFTVSHAKVRLHRDLSLLCGPSECAFGLLSGPMLPVWRLHVPEEAHLWLSGPRRFSP